MVFVKMVNYLPVYLRYTATVNLKTTIIFYVAALE